MYVPLCACVCVCVRELCAVPCARACQAFDAGLSRFDLCQSVWSCALSLSLYLYLHLYLALSLCVCMIVWSLVLVCVRARLLSDVRRGCV